MLDANQTQSRKDFPRRKLASRVVPTTATIILECPKGRATKVEALVVCNVTNAQATIRIHHVTPVESTATSNAILYDLVVRPNSTTTIELPMYLVDGDRIVAQAGTASALCILLYGYDG